MDRQSIGSQFNNLDVQDNVLELEHAIGHSGKIARSIYLHPSGNDFIYISGGCIVICDLNDPHQQFFLREHDDQITCVAISNDGKLIASGQRGDNSDVIIWDYEYKKALFKLSEHDYEVLIVQFSNDDRLLFSCGNQLDKRIFIWDTSNGYIVGSCQIQPDPLICMKWGGFVKDIKGRDTSRYQFATAGNRQVYLWKFDAQAGNFECEYINTGSTIREYLCIEFSKNKEDYLYAGTTSGDFCVFQMKNKVLCKVITVAALGVTSISAVSLTQLLVGCGDGTLASYTIDSGNLIQISKTELIGQINSIGCSEDQTQAIAATDKGFIYRLRTSDLTKMLQCENHTQSVVHLVYPNGVSDRFASCSEDGTIRLWDVSDYIVTSRCTAQNAGSPICSSYNEEVLLSGWADGKIRMFKSESGNFIWAIDNAHKGGVTSIQLSSNLKFLCTGGVEGEVRVWEMKSRDMISHLKEHSHRVTKVQLIGDEMHLLSASKDRALLLWDLKSEKRVSAHIQRMGGINSFDQVPQTQTVLTTGQDRKITYWDLRTPNPVRSIDTNANAKNPDECYSLASSHDGRIFATGGSEQIVRIWDTASGRCISEGKGHSGCINSLTFSYDDKQLISAGKDGNIFLWNIFN